MKHRFTTAELAKFRIPEFPTTPQGWDKRAKNERWPVEIVKGRGRGGERHEYTPPPEIMALIEKRLQGDLPPAEPRPAKVSPPSNQVALASRFYGVSEPGPADVQVEINAHVLWLCHDACLQVYGEAFAQEHVQAQIDYAVDLYNLLLRLSAARRANASTSAAEFNRLDAEEMASQLRLLVQLKWVKPYPPLPRPPKQILF